MLKIILQASFSFIVLLVITRWIGQQQVSQLSYYEYINGITFGSIAANMATDSFDHFYDHLTGVVVYGVLTVVVAYIALKNRNMRKLINGEAVVVIKDGNIVEENLRKSKMNVDELMMLLRLKDVFDFTKVKLALLEDNGDLSVIKNASENMVTCSDLGIKSEADSILMSVIVEGKLVEGNLKKMNLTRNWVLDELSKKKIKQEEVMYAVVDDNKKLLIDMYDKSNNT